MYNNILLELFVVIGKLSFAIFRNSYVVAKDKVVPTVGYSAATCFFILCPNSELFGQCMRYGNRNTILVLSSSVAILLTSIACSIHLLIMLIGNLLSVNIDRYLSNSLCSSDGVHIRLALDVNDLMVASLWCPGQNESYLMYSPVNVFFL